MVLDLATIITPSKYTFLHIFVVSVILNLDAAFSIFVYLCIYIYLCHKFVTLISE